MKGTTIKIIGIVLILISIGTVIYHVKYTKPKSEQIAQDPLKVIRERGQNLKEYHDFKPPFSVYEICIMGIGAAGLVALVIPVGRKSD